MRHYCTYFDSNFLPMGLALYHSLRAHASEPFTLWTLCFDDAALEALDRASLPGLRTISFGDFEAGDAELLGAKENRSRVEYLWTCTPSLPLYILENHPEVDQITYLDADLYFFSDPEPIFREFEGKSIMIVGHRFPAVLQERERFGIYNVSWMIFRRDTEGLLALRWWRDRCIEWCYDRFEDGKYADQKYLDDWPERFKGVVVLQHKGAGVAPWNLSRYRLSVADGRVFVDECPLIFYHFHRFRFASRNVFSPGIESYLERQDGGGLGIQHVRHIYHPYAEDVDRFRTIDLPPPAGSWRRIARLVLNGKGFLLRPKQLSLLVGRLSLRRG